MRWTYLAVLVALSAAPALAQSTGGDDDLEINVGSKAAPAPTAPPPPAPAAVAPPAKPAEDSALRKEVDDLRHRLAALEAKPAPAPPPPPAPVEPPAGELLPKGVHVSGYLQLQYTHSDLSQDQIQQGGTPLNLNRFAVRRGRVRLTGDWDFASFLLELDGNTNNGASVGLRRAEASLFWRQSDAGKPPLLKGTVGLTRIPFGAEVIQSEQDLLFLERSASSLAFFPGPQDVGITASGGVGAFRYALAIFGGSPSDSGVTIPLTGLPTFLGRVGAEHTAPDALEVGGGVSFLSGTGLSPGTDATKSTVTWQDLNENGIIDEGETTGVPGTTARPSTTFHRWAVNADVHGGLKTPIGWTRLFAEVTMAANLDRGFLVADPVLVGHDVREAGFVAGVLQEITKYAFVGFRADVYNPNADFLDSRRGQVFVTNQSVTTLSPALGAVLPGRGRLAIQYNAILDSLARNTNGVPTDLRNNTFGVRLQGEF